MSRPGASWWPDEVVEELPGNSPKRCKLEDGGGRPTRSSLPHLLPKIAETTKSDESVKSENPKKNDELIPTGETGTSTQPADSGKHDEGVWVVRKIVEESSEDEDDLNSSNEEHDSSGGPGHSHNLPGRLEDEFNNMCLHEATEKRLFSIIFKKKEDVNHVNEWGETPLHFAAEIGATSIAALLIDKGANPNAIDDDGFTPLILASSFGHAEVAEILLEAGANIHYLDDLMMAPIHFAAHGGFEDVVRVLLDHGANPAHEDRAGHMPCDFAFYGGHLQLAEYLFKILDGGQRAQHEEDRPPVEADCA